MKNEYGYGIEYPIVKRVPDIWYLSDSTLRELVKIFPYYSSEALELLIKFYYTYTQLEYKKLYYFTDCDIIEFSKQIIYLLVDSQLRGSSYVAEDGTYIDSNYGPSDRYDFNTRYDFLFLLLKCKYSAEQAHSILDYYTELTNLDYDKLTAEFKLYEPDWKEIADRMEYNKDGKVKSTFNFISNVIL